MLNMYLFYNPKKKEERELCAIQHRLSTSKASCSLGGLPLWRVF